MGLPSIQRTRRMIVTGVSLHSLLWGASLLGLVHGLTWCEPLVGLHGVWLVFRLQDVTHTWSNLRTWEEELRGHES